MIPRIASAAACLLVATAPAPAVGFAPPSSLPPPCTAAAPTSSSSSSAALRMATAQHAAEDMYPQLLDKASLCAHSDSCSIESAELYLSEVIYVQNGCAAGTLSGSAVCDDVLRASAVVADLRKKIGEGARREVRTWLSAPQQPAYLAVAALCAVLAMSVFPPAATDVPAGGVAPFAAQEVWWAIQDGYAPDLADHFWRNGGLLVSDSAGAAGSSLSPQELLWSVRDGYAADALSSGGGGGVESVPFAPREIWWAVRGGYASDLVGHWFRNGGLSM